MKKILVVDDEPAPRDLVQMVLTREGYQVTVASDGQTDVVFTGPGGRGDT